MRIVLATLLTLFSLTSFVFGQNPTGGVKATVYDQTSGQPLPNVWVYLMTDSSSGNSYYNTLPTGGDGSISDFNIPIFGNATTLLTVGVYDCQQQWIAQQVNVYAGQITPVIFTICGSNNTNCQGDFTYMPGMGPQNTFHFNGTAINGVAPFTYQWSFGSTEQNATYTFPGPGSYSVCLTIADANGCVNETCQTIWVGDSLGGGCNASFSSQANINTFYFNTNGGQNTYYAWDFGDGQHSNEPYPAHTYDAPGSYNVCLTVYGFGANGDTCTDTQCQYVWVDTLPEMVCDASFYMPFPSGNTVSLFPNGNFYPNLTYVWDFGDGTYSNESQPTHTYNAPGSYNICLTVYGYSADGDSCSDTKCNVMTITGGGGNCNAEFGAQINQSTASFSPYSQILYQYYYWSFGDGTTGDGQFATHTYAQPGSYTVCLTVYGADSCTNTQCQTVYIEGGNGDCNADFGVQSYQSNTGYFNAYMGNATNYFWDFGDGAYAETAYPNHTYSAPGYYTVCLYVNNIVNGAVICSDTLCKTVFIEGSQQTGCNAAFSAYTVSGNTVSFYSTADSSTSWIANYAWTFGDGATSNESYPYHEYAQPGTYNVCLTVYGFTANGDTCTDTKCQVIQVGQTQGQYSLCGTVSLNGVHVSGAVVTLIQIIDQEYTVLQTITANTVDYCFNNLEPGNYMVMALYVDSVAYAMPTYGGDTLFWLNAAVTNITDANAWLNIELVTADGTMYGPGFIGGTVFGDFGKTSSVVANVPIYIFNEQGKALGYVVSDANGNYAFPNIAYGTYRLHAELVGKLTIDKWVTISAENPVINNAELELHTLVTATQNAMKELTTVSPAYPNPTTAQTNVAFILERATTADVRILDVNGREISSFQTRRETGRSVLSLPTENLPSGVYSVEIKMDGQKYVRKVVKQ